MQTLKKRIIASHIKIKTKMKVKNLLLAGLAVAAMTACSNENDEIVNNGNQNPETAFMQLSFEVPGSRATSVDNKDDEQGTADEYGVQTVDVKLTYNDGSTKELSKPIEDFDVAKDGQTLILTNVEVVPAGTITKATAVLNKKTLNPWSATPFTVVGSGLNYLTSGIAEAKNFLMSGEITEAKEFVAGATTNIVIPVSRVSAKLDEVTDTKTFPIAANADAGAQINEIMKITLDEYSYGNLALQSNILEGDVANQTYFYTYGTTKDNYTYNKMSNDAVVYCLENAATEGLQKNSTYVVYKATVTFGDVAPATPFYVWNNTIYKTLAELKAANAGIGESFTDDSTQAEFLAKHVYKYENGECFYMTEVDYATNNHKIVRNTWYKLEVESIAKLGFPTPEVPPTFDEAYMNLKITINPWKVRFNKIQF